MSTENSIDVIARKKEFFLPLFNALIQSILMVTHKIIHKFLHSSWVIHVCNVRKGKESKHHLAMNHAAWRCLHRQNSLEFRGGGPLFNPVVQAAAENTVSQLLCRQRHSSRIKSLKYLKFDVRVRIVRNFNDRNAKAPKCDLKLRI